MCIKVARYTNPSPYHVIKLNEFVNDFMTNYNIFYMLFA